MKTWAEFESEQPTMAVRGRELIYRSGDGEGMLVTVRDDVPPRVHPVNAGIFDGHFYTFVQGKSRNDATWTRTADTRSTPTSTLRRRTNSRSVAAPSRSRMPVIATRSPTSWFFNVQDTYPLYELFLEHALLGHRPTANDWPPVYTRWSDTHWSVGDPKEPRAKD